MKRQDSSMRSAVMARIGSGKVSMRPRVYFTLMSFAVGAASLASGLLLAYTTSIFTYIVRIQTADTPAYGAKANLASALAEFPWWLLVVALLLVAGTVWLARRNTRLYRRSFSSIVGFLVIVSMLVGVALSYAGVGHPDETLHREFQQSAPGRGLHHLQ